MDDLQQQLQSTFLAEAQDLLARAEQGCLLLESGGGDHAALEDIFRLAHNLKGSARAVGFMALSGFTHSFESLLLRLKEKTIALSPETVSLLLRCVDDLARQVRILPTDPAVTADPQLEEALKAALSGRPPAPAARAAPPAPNDGLVLFEPQTPTPQPPAPALAEPADGSLRPKPLRPSRQAIQGGDDSIRVNLRRVEQLVNAVGELVILQSVLYEHRQHLPSQLLQTTAVQLTKITREIQSLSMGLRMVALKPTFLKMHRIVRDSAAALGKTIQLVTSGDDTELDKTVVDCLGDPLVHMIRNSIDHGVETPAERAAAGKPELGTITLSAGHRGGRVMIEVKDDGRGLNIERIRAKAIEKGLIAPQAELSEKDLQALIFRPGFSTKAEVTDLSGRGVGMDVVKTNVEELLQGSVEVESKAGEGTLLRISLPLTLAIIEGMLVGSGSERYVVPLAHVHETLKFKLDERHVVSGTGEVLKLRGEVLPLHRLSSLLGRRPDAKGDSALSGEEAAIVVRTGEKAFSIVVDRIIGRHQVVVKRLGDEANLGRGITGGAILGDGHAALILDLAELVERGRPQRARSPNLQRGAA